MHSNFPSDIIGVIATFLPEDIEAQRPLMLVNHTWFQGVIGQDGMKPKPTINWPACTLKYRQSPSLKLELNKASNADLEYLAQCERQVGAPFVKQLTIVSCGGITDDGLTHLKQLQALASLQIKWCPRITREGMKHLKDVRSLTALHVGGDVAIDDITELPLLAALRLEIINDVTDVEIKHLLKCAETLTSLELDRCQLSDVGCVDTIAKLKHLTSLRVFECSGVTDLGIQAITSELKKLTLIDIGNCRGCTDASLEHIANGLPALKTLRFGGTNRIADDSMPYLEKLQETLTELSITGCKISNESLRYLANCRSLSKLILAGCPNVGDAGVETTIAAIESLEFLNLSGNDITNSSIESLKRLPNLTTLDVNFCRHLTNDAVAHLKAFPQLKSVNLLGTVMTRYIYRAEEADNLLPGVTVYY